MPNLIVSVIVVGDLVDSNIQSDLARLNPSEVLITKQLSQDKTLSNALKNYHVTIRAEEEFGEIAKKTLETHFKQFNAASLSWVC
jgi:DNA mismatch repair ATPase MutS